MAVSPTVELRRAVSMADSGAAEEHARERLDDLS